MQITGHSSAFLTNRVVITTAKVLRLSKLTSKSSIKQEGHAGFTNHKSAASDLMIHLV